MPAQISRLDFATINDTQKRALYGAMQHIGDKHGIVRAWWAAARAGYNGRQYIITYWAPAPATAEQFANAIFPHTEYGYGQVLGVIDDVVHATGSIVTMFAQMQAYMHAGPARLAQWEFEELPGWLTYVGPVEFIEPEEPPEGWPVSRPQEWYETPEEPEE